MYTHMIHMYIHIHIYICMYAGMYEWTHASMYSVLCDATTCNGDVKRMDGWTDGRMMDG